MDTNKNWEGVNPWLGLCSYKEGIKLYGRDFEVSTLSDIVCNNISTVVFGKSGIGKSSLIHAGIFPEIRKKGMMPIHIRLEHNSNISYTVQIENAVCKILKKEDTLNGERPQLGLWDFFHRHIFKDERNNIRIPVVVIDQFEEIYTLADSEHKHQAQELFEELADLLNNIKPDKVIQHENNDIKFTESKIEMGTNDILTFRIHSGKKFNYIDENNFHFVICLREDYLYYLERNTSKIPSFKINRFSLQALNKESALDVIMQPRPGMFCIEEANEIIKKIATFNDEGKEEIDPTILSIYLFKYFNKKGDIRSDNIINEFYHDEIKNISLPSVAYLEDYLITGEGFRHSIPLNDALAYGLKREELDILLKNRILTIEPKKGHDYLEFSHDIICTIAKKNREKRHIDEQARKLKKRILAVTLLLAIAILLISTFSYLNYEVERNRRMLKVSETKNHTMQAQYMIRKGDVLNAIKLMLNIIPYDNENINTHILPETETALNEAYDSLHSGHSCISIMKHYDDVISAEFSKDSKYIITASNDSLCRIWNSASGELYKEFKIADVTTASSNSDCTKIAASLKNGSISIWDTKTQKITVQLNGHTSLVNHVCFSPNGEFIISASKDKTVRMWNAKTGKYIETIVEHKENVNTAFFSNDGKKIITSSNDGSSIIYDIQAHTSKKIFTNEDNSVVYACFNHDDTKIAIATDSTVYILNQEGTIEKSLKGHKDLITSAAFNSEGLVATSSHDKTIKLWDIATGNEIYTYIGHSNIVKKVTFSPDGKSILSASRDNDARLWNAQQYSSNSKVINGDIGRIVSASFSPDGKYIAAISENGEAGIWNTATNDIVSRFKVSEMANSITFNSKADKVAVVSDCDKIRIFDVYSGNIADSIEISGEIGYDYAFYTKDESLIAISHILPTLKINPDEHSYKRIISPQEDTLTCMTLSPEDSIALIANTNNSTFKLWNTKEKRYLKSFEGHSKDICSIKFSHDYKRIISASSDNTALIWNIETNSIIHKLKKHSSQVFFAEFSQDDSYAITASTDGTIKLWNTTTGDEVATRKTSSTPKYSYMFSPTEQRYMIINEEDIFIYDLLTPEKLVNIFINMFENIKLTKDEKEQYSLS